MRIRDIKVIFQADTAGRVRVENGDAGRPAIDPAPKLAIPFLNLQHGGGVRALGKKQKLLIEAETVIAADCGQESLPLLRLCHALSGALIQLGDQLVFFSHRLILLFLRLS